MASVVKGYRIEWLSYDVAAGLSVAAVAVLIAELVDDLAKCNIGLRLGGVLPQVPRMLEHSGALARLGPDSVFRTLKAAVDGSETHA